MHALTDDIEPWGLDAMQQQVDSERRASDKQQDRAPQHGTECCADTGDGPRDLAHFGLTALLASGLLVAAIAAWVVLA